MIFRKQDKQYDNEVSTFDASFALFIMSVGIITLNSLVCIGTMMYTNYNYTPTNLTNPTTPTPTNPAININKNLFTGIWYKIDSNYSNLHIYQNNDVSLKNEPNTNLVNGYVDYKTNAIYMNDDIAYNISYVHSINNAYSFTILYDNVSKKYNVYRKYNYVVNIAFINKLITSLP
jgi:hypothetical protein